MSAFGMQVACGCDSEAQPMENITSWDSDTLQGAFVPGRRYVWQCLTCGHTVCINMKLMEEAQ